MDKLFEGICRKALQADPSKVLLYLEAAQDWVRNKNQNSLQSLYSYWYKDKPIRELMKSCVIGSHVRGYSSVYDVGDIREGDTYRLESQRVMEWTKNKDKAYEEAEKYSLGNPDKRSAIVSRLIPRGELIFDFGAVDYLKEYGVSLGKGYFENTIIETLNSGWDENTDSLIAVGEETRSQVCEVFGLSTNKEDLKNDILEDIMKKLEI